jgi:hypothetical protein
VDSPRNERLSPAPRLEAAIASDSVAVSSVIHRILRNR